MTIKAEFPLLPIRGRYQKHNTGRDSDVILSTIDKRRHVGGILVGAKQCNVLNLGLHYACVWNYTPVEIHGLQIIFGRNISRIPYLFFVHIEYTCNMVVCYDNM